MSATNAKTAEPAQADAGASGSKAPLLLALLNTVALLGAMGALTYTRVLYRRPAITEAGERARLEKLHEAPPASAQAALVNFEPVTVNIASSPLAPKPADGTSQQILGKLHYATIGFALEISDASHKDDIDAVRPMIMDKFISMLGHRRFNELNNVQGRYVLRTKLIEAINRIVTKNSARILSSMPSASEGGEGEGKAKPRGNAFRERPDELVTNVYFTQFIVQ